MRNILPLSQFTCCSRGVDMSWFCSVCEKSFSRKDSMQRNVMSKHRTAGLKPFQSCFEHPFTSIIAGMTGSGKTAWVRSLLQQASETIYPPPERIVWCYSQLSLNGHLELVPAFLYSPYLTLYKTDFSLRRAHSTGPKGVRLTES